MAGNALITRRAALVGAAVSTASLAVPVAASVRPASIEELALKFIRDCQAIDPTVIGSWVGFDETMNGPRADRVQSVYLTREHAPFLRPAK